LIYGTEQKFTKEHFTVKTLLEWIKKEKKGTKYIGGTTLIASLEHKEPSYLLGAPYKLTYEEWEDWMILHSLDDWVAGTLFFIHDDEHVSGLFMPFPDEIAEHLGMEVRYE